MQETGHGRREREFYTPQPAPLPRRRADEIARRVEHVALATRPEFQAIFVNAMNLEEDESVTVAL